MSGTNKCRIPEEARQFTTMQMHTAWWRFWEAHSKRVCIQRPLPIKRPLLWNRPRIRKTQSHTSVTRLDCTRSRISLRLMLLWVCICIHHHTRTIMVSICMMRTLGRRFMWRLHLFILIEVPYWKAICWQKWDISVIWRSSGLILWWTCLSRNFFLAWDYRYMLWVVSLVRWIVMTSLF